MLRGVLQACQATATIGNVCNPKPSLWSAFHNWPKAHYVSSGIDFAFVDISKTDVGRLKALV